MTRAHAYDTRLVHLFWLFLGAAVLLSFAYLYFVNQAVLNIVSRQASEKAMSALTRELSALESRYVVLQGELTQERAAEFGLVPAQGATFVDSRTTLRALSLRDGI